jgi:ABC-type uncharacterized transport system substrate-binding protein
MKTPMRRREFITFLGSAGAAWPLAAWGQQPRVRRVGVLFGFSESSPEWQTNFKAFQAGLAEAGWMDGRNLRMDVRWGIDNSGSMRANAAALVGLSPEVILATPHGAAAVLHELTSTIPIVAVQSGDMVDAGFVQSYARPGGNITGFTLFETTINSKFLQLLKDIAPQLTQVAVVQTESSAWRGDFKIVEVAARSYAVRASAIIFRAVSDLDRLLAAFAAEPNGGLIFPPDATTGANRELIAALAAKHRLPTIMTESEFVNHGGLMTYGTDFTDIYRRAAGYVDRILKGAKPADLPVQAPVKFELRLNLKTAKTLGLDPSTALLISASDVIE